MSEENRNELSALLKAVADEMRRTMPLSMVLLADLVREKLLAEGFPEQPTFADIMDNATVGRWTDLVGLRWNPEEQDRLAREWIDEIDKEKAVADE